MKIQELLNERSMQVLFHMTNVRNAVNIIKTAQFKLSHYGEHGDSMEGDEPVHVEYYYMSTTRSAHSGFFDLMLTEVDVILVLSGTRLAQRNKIAPYQDETSQMEFGDSFDEMEERIFSDKPILQIQQPINQTILAVHAMNLMDADVYDSISNEHIKSRGTPEHMKQLWYACKNANIPLYQYEDMERFKMLKPG